MKPEKERPWWKNAIYISLGLLFLGSIYGMIADPKEFFLEKGFLYILIGLGIIIAIVWILSFLDAMGIRKHSERL